MMRFIMAILLLMGNISGRSDTIDHYINIANAIPRMEVKADSQSQAWARSARNVLKITTETVAETLLQVNNLAKMHGAPLFCLPSNVHLNAVTMDGLILKTYHNISSQNSDKNKMTISQVALLAVTKSYPCQPSKSLFQNLSQLPQQQVSKQGY